MGVAGRTGRSGCERSFARTPLQDQHYGAQDALVHPATRARVPPEPPVVPLIPDQGTTGGIRWGYGGIAAARAGLTRLVVLSPTNQAGTPAARLWTNVEMTVYARREASARRLDYQAFYLSARSGERHNDSAPCEGTSY